MTLTSASHIAIGTNPGLAEASLPYGIEDEEYDIGTSSGHSQSRASSPNQGASVRALVMSLGLSAATPNLTKKNEASTRAPLIPEAHVEPLRQQVHRVNFDQTFYYTAPVLPAAPAWTTLSRRAAAFGTDFTIPLSVAAMADSSVLATTDSPYSGTFVSTPTPAPAPKREPRHKKPDFMARTAELYYAKARAKMPAQDVEVKSPWNESLSPEQRAADHRYVIEKTYGTNGHPSLAEPMDSLIRRQKAGTLLTWTIYWKGFPVGTASIGMQSDGTAELCRAAALPKGTRLPDGTIYNGEVPGSAVQYQRLGDFLSHPTARSAWALMTTLRMSQDVPLGDGRKILSGSVTQHVNYGKYPYDKEDILGVTPFVFVLPLYLVTPPGRDPYTDGLMESRLHLQPERVFVSAPLYTPAFNPRNLEAVSQAEIAKATWPHAFGEDPHLITDEIPADDDEKIIKIDDSHAPHYVTITLSGPITTQEIEDTIAQAYERVPVIQIDVPNRPGNIGLQNKLYALSGIVPVGVLPGGHFQVGQESLRPETVFRFAIGKSSVREALQPIQLASDFDDSPIKAVARRVYALWKDTETP